MRRAAIGLALAVAAAAALPAGAGGRPAPPVNPLCTQFRAADATAFAQIFPGRGGAALCTRIQAHREACVFQTARNLQAPATFSFSFSCRTPARGAAGPKRVTQLILSVRRNITALGPVLLAGATPAPAGFRCGVRRYPGRATDVCIGGIVPYGKLATGTIQVSPPMGCDVRPLVALRVANGNWDIFAVAKAPRTLNGPPCPGRHF